MHQGDCGTAGVGENIFYCSCCSILTWRHNFLELPAQLLLLFRGCRCSPMWLWQCPGLSRFSRKLEMKSVQKQQNNCQEVLISFQKQQNNCQRYVQVYEFSKPENNYCEAPIPNSQSPPHLLCPKETLFTFFKKDNGMSVYMN